MVKNNLISLIPAMQQKLSKIIEENKFNLQSKKVLTFSQKLDQILNHYHGNQNNKLYQSKKNITQYLNCSGEINI